MIYIIMAAVLGYAGWQLIKIVKNSRKGTCASGCSACESNQNCSIQVSNLLQIETLQVHSTVSETKDK